MTPRLAAVPLTRIDIDPSESIPTLLPGLVKTRPPAEATELRQEGVTTQIIYLPMTVNTR